MVKIFFDDMTYVNDELPGGEFDIKTKFPDLCTDHHGNILSKEYFSKMSIFMTDKKSDTLTMPEFLLVSQMARCVPNVFEPSKIILQYINYCLNSDYFDRMFGIGDLYIILRNNFLGMQSSVILTESVILPGKFGKDLSMTIYCVLPLITLFDESDLPVLEKIKFANEKIDISFHRAIASRLFICRDCRSNHKFHVIELFNKFMVEFAKLRI